MNRREIIAGGAALTLGALPLRAWGGGKIFANSIAVEDGRVWMAAMIGDKGPFFFIIDTGSSMSMIEDAFAKRMGFQKMAGQAGMGIGGISDYSWYNAGTVTLASGIRFPDMLFAGMREAPGEDAVGLFGAGLFTAQDSDLDFAAGIWRAYPGGRPNFDGLVKLKSRFIEYGGGHLINLDASIDDFEGEFCLDTGSPGAVFLFSRATAKSGLWDDARPYAPVQTQGVGKDSVPGRIVRAKQLKLGPVTFNNVLVRLSDPGSPRLPGADGLIGLKAMEHMHLSTDVSAQRVWVAQNNASVKPQTYPLSGLWIEDRKGRVTIDDVGTGSPAAMAGLAKGDIVVSDIGALSGMINGGPGKPVKLTIERAGKRQDVSYTLKPWL